MRPRAAAHAAGARLAAACAALALAGCYVSDRQLLDGAQAARPLATGAAQMDSGPIRIDALAGGLYRLTSLAPKNRDGPATLLFVPLGGGPAPPGYAVSLQAGPGPGVVYGVARRRGDHVVLSFPLCDQDAARAFALAAGARNKGSANGRVCEFADRRGLLQALRAFAAATPPAANDAELPAAGTPRREGPAAWTSPAVGRTASTQT